MAVSQITRPSVFVNAAFRSPIGKFGGALKALSAPKLAALTLKEALLKTQMQNPDAVLMGHARQAGAGPNTARQAVIFSGLAETIPAWTINHACASGMSAIAQGMDKIFLNKARNLWVGGVESMSNTPYLVPSARWGTKLGHQKIVDAMYQDGFHCPMADMLMGETVERFLASERKISRKRQDEWAYRSHVKAADAIQKGAFKDEILVIDFEKTVLDHDEAVRADTSLDSLSKLEAVFAKEGTVSAGNSSSITDGAAWLWLSQEKTATTLCELVDYEVTALNPRKMGLGPVQSIQNLLKKNNLQTKDIAQFEINEAFAAQVLACKDDLKIPDEKLNLNGGAIALGHPIGATGARILVTLIHQLKKQKGAYGVASLCVSGGQGFSILVKS
ncbi:MAG: thiolase family protein [bacterium]